jgi:predicted nucleic acid-binding protein
VNPSQEEIDTCAAFFPESELSDIVHAANCLYANAVLITNDNHFNKIKKAEIIEVWSNTKAIKRLLDGIRDFEDFK